MSGVETVAVAADLHNVATIGLDLGGTKLAAGLVRNGKVLRRLETPTPLHLGPLLDTIESMVSDLQGSEQLAIGLGVPGPVVNGETTFFSNLQGLNDSKIEQVLAQRLGRPVAFENDANLAALAESRYGSARGTQHSVYLTWSTGIGCGLILNGEIFSGRTGMAGEVGHTRMGFSGTMDGSGTLGTLEAQACGAALARDASFVYGQPTSVPAIFEKMAGGDERATDLIRNAAAYLGRFLHNLQLLLDPEVVVLGGGLMTQASLLLPMIETERRRTRALHDFTPLRLSHLGPDAGIVGAAEFACQGDHQVRGR
ncbi:ROK family protein [Deinococcus detaillensis]|uniref:ROK family protein n=1 Tax=Deinococcus detaillensis TaxID=2592048 RepID=A0A553UJJ7_9DEIO|nr:ROK family protein [Deinococcus detaillensis]